MRLSSPIYKLKREAKTIAREQDLPRHRAVDQIAAREGFQSWSHLVIATTRPAQRVYDSLAPGDMVLIGARPGQGKTLLALEVAALAARRGTPTRIFTLDYNAMDVANRYPDLGIDPSRLGSALSVDASDEICADHIVGWLSERSQPAVAVIDYLQILDQRRSTPRLNDQIKVLKTATTTAGHVVLAISQIDRGFDLSGRSMPDRLDVRRPNPLDLTLFDKNCFLHGGAIELTTAA